MTIFQYKCRKALIACTCLVAAPVALMAQDSKWPEQTPTTKAGSRWWWLGSAVDKDNLRWNIQEYAKTGIGSLEITPIYGVKGNESNELGFLTAPWMDALKFVEEEGKRNGVLIDMNAGTGWPFGGPNVPIEEAACKAVFVDTVLVGADFKDIDLSAPEKERRFSTLQKAMAFGAESKVVIDVTDNIVDGKLNWKASVPGKWRFIALYIGRTRQQVKRAAPNGEGYVIDHFDRNAVKHYLENLERGFAANNTPYPHTFFNDSYEVYGADWTPTLLQEFKQRRGYDLAEQFDKLLDCNPQTISDYRETLGDMLLENFTEQWTAWAHSHGALTRNQAHGSPANLIDVYAAVDIPEIEGFGLSEFGIKGLRKDSGYTRKNDSDVSMLKYASSAAHITGKPLTSSETFTWLTEHFRTSLSQMKPDLDLMFTCGVNHVFFHGTTYSPKNDPWPGWKFYASVDMSPTNNIWRDAPELMKYIDRSQRFLQMGKPDNDFLIYLPVRDMWKQNTNTRLLQFDIHGMAKKAPQFIKDVLAIDKMGYDVDYISDRYLLGTTFENGMLKTAAGTRYKALILPTGCTLPENVRQHLEALKAKGAKVISHIDARQISDAAKAEQMRLEGLRALRRSNDNGHHYFIANLTPNDVCKRMKLAVEGKSATWYNPMNGDIVAADFNNDGVMVELRSGESRILVLSNNAADTQAASNASNTLNTASTSNTETITLNGKWTLSFINSAPKVSKTFTLQSLQTWEGLDDDSVKVTMGTGVYSTTLKLNKKQAKQHWTIDLGDVRESARVYINDQYIGCAWAVPFVLDCKDALKAGNNTIRIEVTNLPANRIAWLDRQGVEWRKFKEINVVDINYKKTNYADWAPVPSGLNSKVRLIGKIK